MTDQDKTSVELQAEIHQLQQQVAQLQAHLGATQERLEVSLRVGNLAWWDWHYPTGRVNFHERKALMLGYTPDELEPEVYAFTRMIHPDDYEQAMEAARRHLVGELPVYETEYRLRTKSGDWKWFYDRGAVVERDAAGKPIRLVGVVWDISRHKQTEAILQSTNNELAHLNSDKDRFFSILAHDLKSPFMPLLGNTELLAELGDTLSPNEVKQIGISTQRAAKNVFNLLDNLLHWAQLQMGRMDYQPQWLDLSQIVNKSVELLFGNAVIKQIDLHSEVKAETWGYGDENMLDTVIRNLISNALKFTPRNGQVIISARTILPASGVDEEQLSHEAVSEKGGYIEMAIADTGVGVPESVKEKLFKLDHHVTTVGTGKETGTGLGLLICQEMVLKGGGCIWLESEWGKGTTVKFSIPILGNRIAG